jgi:acyl carrier protein
MKARRGVAAVAGDDDVQDVFEHIVRHAIARHLTVEPHDIVRSQALRHDLGMDVRDIAFVLVRLEDVARIEFPHATAHLVRTVADLTNLFRALSSRGSRASGGDTDGPRFVSPGGSPR